MKLKYGEAEEAFRAELDAWLEANYPPESARHPEPRSSADLVPWVRQWQRTLFDAGWLVPGWPPELGGRNATPVQQMIYFEELSGRHITRSANPQGLGIIAPSIRDYGTPEQQEQFLLPTLRAEISWCLGMSEPNAGSDLAGLQTRAVLEGDEFVVNGQKIWTSGAHHADWCLCFVRTDPNVPKHKGISALIIDTTSPGVERRPFPDLLDRERTDFNEVFFTDVRVPRANLLGELHQGWPLTQGSLAHERSMLWIDYAYSMDRIVDTMRGLADHVATDGTRLGADVHFRDAIANAHVDAEALRCIGYRGFSKFSHGRAAPEHSLLKLFGSESIQRAILSVVDLLGPDALELGGDTLFHHGERPWGQQYLYSFAGTIPGGTSEIQRNIIAERVLGLPRR
ncbi:MAG: putative acyl-CoA dehydrogenase [Actinomycetia bacterium]|nr:putative acyl-CoA dehydrogenase [Actinomycetes bacterium]